MTAPKPYQEPHPIGSSKGTLNLAHYYLEHGESPSLEAVEAALTFDWQTTKDVAEASGKSVNYCLKALDYLALMGRAEREHERWQPRPFKRSVTRYLWRKPTEPREPRMLPPLATSA